MKKFWWKNKFDIVSIILLTGIFIGLIKVLTINNYLYGSTLDWSAQHAVIPDYFRLLFYKTKDLLPDFAMNIGSGQNIYNLSYYGFLSPIILISYLLPKVSMATYISISTIIIVLISTYMLYFFLRKKEYSSSVSFVACLSFMLSSSISLHSHRHIMFINYMPFLILGLMGVDKVFDKGKSWLLSLSVFLMIMTSYYFSVGGLVCIFLYGLIRYLKLMNKVSIKSLFKYFIKILYPVLVGICASAILTIPTLATLLYNRADSNIFITLKDLLIPDFKTYNILYKSYGLGLTMIIIPAIVNLFTKKNKEGITLGIILTLFSIFNVFNYIFNGTMYIDAKSLIPLLPIYILVEAEFIKDIINRKLNLKVLIPVMLIVTLLVYFSKSVKWSIFTIDEIIVLVAIMLYYIFKKKEFLCVPICLFMIIFCYFVNKDDSLVLKYNYNDIDKNISSLVDNITERDNSFYRISTDINITETPNKIFNNIDYYNSTIYSSISNQIYNKFYYDTLFNNMPARNRALTISNPNILSLMLLNNKYIINNNENLVGYDLVDTNNNGINVYKNSNVLPLGFATKEVMSYKDFYELSDQEKQEALLNVIVTNKESNNTFKTTMEQVKLNFDEVLKNDSVIRLNDGTYNIYTTKDLKITYELPEQYKNKILLIRFNMNKVSKHTDLTISINGVKNKLTSSSWKYYNGNVVFDYVLAYEKQDKLVLTFSKGDYNIGDFQVYVLDYSNIENVNKKVDNLIVDKEESKGDKIVGKINVTNDGYFMATIPYDKGFKIKVDDKVQNYEKVDDSFIGLPITKGLHEIEIEYEAPLKDIGAMISILGCLVFVVMTILENRKMF